jgi:hypothetical protein
LELEYAFTVLSSPFSCVKNRIDVGDIILHS